LEEHAAPEVALDQIEAAMIDEEQRIHEHDALTYIEEYQKETPRAQPRGKPREDQ